MVAGPVNDKKQVDRQKTLQLPTPPSEDGLMPDQSSRKSRNRLNIPRHRPNELKANTFFQTLGQNAEGHAQAGIIVADNIDFVDTSSHFFQSKEQEIHCEFRYQEFLREESKHSGLFPLCPRRQCFCNHEFFLPPLAALLIVAFLS